VAITALDLLFKVGNNAWRAVADLSLYAMLAFGAYLLFALIRWPFERMSKSRREQRAAANAEDEPTLREIMQEPAAQQRRGGYVDSSIDPRSDGRVRIEPRL